MWDFPRQENFFVTFSKILCETFKWLWEKSIGKERKSKQHSTGALSSWQAIRVNKFLRLICVQRACTRVCKVLYMMLRTEELRKFQTNYDLRRMYMKKCFRKVHNKISHSHISCQRKAVKNLKHSPSRINLIDVFRVWVDDLYT